MGTKVVSMTYAATDLLPPGRAHIEGCPDCRGVTGLRCPECRGTARIVYRACPRCGDIAWDFVNGYSDENGMACRISCGYRWTADDPAWLAQRLP